LINVKEVLQGIGADKIATRVADKVLGESTEDSLKREQVENDHELQEQALENDRMEDLQNFIVQYEGEASKVPAPLLYIRSTPRPIAFVYCIFAVFIAEFTGHPIALNSLAGVTTLSILISFLGSKLFIDLRK
jgi:hypothetical protein